MKPQKASGLTRSYKAKTPSMSPLLRDALPWGKSGLPSWIHHLEDLSCEEVLLDWEQPGMDLCHHTPPLTWPSPTAATSRPCWNRRPATKAAVRASWSLTMVSVYSISLSSVTSCDLLASFSRSRRKFCKHHPRNSFLSA